MNSSEARPDFPREPRCRDERLGHLQGNCRGKNQPDVFRVVGIKQHRATQLNSTRSFVVGKKGAERCVLVEGIQDGDLTIGVIESIEDIGAGVQPVECLTVGVFCFGISPDALGKILAPPGEASFVPQTPFGLDLKLGVEVVDLPQSPIFGFFIDQRHA